MDYVDTDAYVAPSTDTEHLLCQIFADIFTCESSRYS